MPDRKTIAVVVQGLEQRNNSKINTAIVAKLVDSLEKNPRVGLACMKAKISVGTFHAWYHKWPEFATLVDEAQASGITQIEDKLFQNAMAGNVVAQIFLMKKWRPERYEDSVMVTEPKKPIRYDPNKLTIAEQEELERLSAKARIHDQDPQPVGPGTEG